MSATGVRLRPTGNVAVFVVDVSPGRTSIRNGAGTVRANRIGLGRRWNKRWWARAGAKGVVASASDRGSQYLSIRYSETVWPRPGLSRRCCSVWRSYYNRWPRRSFGCQTELIDLSTAGPWRNLEAFEFATLEWVIVQNNHRRLLESDRSISHKRNLSMLTINQFPSRANGP